MTTPRRIEVVAGVLHHPDGGGRVLLAQRPAHKVRGGLWEFPGGKIEPGEHPLHALERELREELGIELLAACRLFQLQHHYPDLTIRLRVWSCLRFAGEPQPLDASALRWQRLEAPDLEWPDLSVADARLRRWLRLPDLLTISADCVSGAETAWLSDAQQAAPIGLLLVRTPSLPCAALRSLCFALIERRPDLAGRLLVSADVALARELGIGVHLKAAQLSAPLPMSVAPAWLGASCHDAEELRLAASLGCDYATLGPVLPTASHPGAPALGWHRFHDLVQDAHLPVYALGGQHPYELSQARRDGALGVAGISAFWPTINDS